VKLKEIMRLSVRHETLYRYSAPVRLAPHVLRLNPRADGSRILSRSLIVDPPPARRHESTDRFDNRVTHVSFEGLSDFLRIESRFVLEMHPIEPPRDPGLPRLPWSSGPQDVLAEYRRDDQVDDAVEAFAIGLASECRWAPLPFLDRLSQTLFTRFERRIRVEGAAQTPVRTLATGSGACRDLTVLFMAACRSLRIAARFVSGYQAHAETPDGQRHLHAWPEVFLPGLGWRGYDPTHGIPVTDGHVALSVAADQADTMPVEGGFFGSGVTSTLEYSVQITVSDK
jgi:transglutaminase-like putative cysteine protease